MQLPWPQQLSNGFETSLPEFNPEKFPIFVAELSSLVGGMIAWKQLSGYRATLSPHLP
jgi:hypothetical protein